MTVLTEFSPHNARKQTLTRDESEQPLQTGTVRSGSVQSPVRLLGLPWCVPLSLRVAFAFSRPAPVSVIVRLWPCSDDADERGCVVDLGGVQCMWTLDDRAAALARRRPCSAVFLVCWVVLASLLSAASARPRSNVGSRPGGRFRAYINTTNLTQVTIQASQASVEHVEAERPARTGVSGKAWGGRRAVRGAG